MIDDAIFYILIGFLLGILFSYLYYRYGMSHANYRKIIDDQCTEISRLKHNDELWRLGVHPDYVNDVYYDNFIDE